MDICDNFSSTYREARSKFLKQAVVSGATLHSHCHPSLLGPTEEELAVDIAQMGPAACDRVLMVVSGTHGVEGHAGSACQLDLLASGACDAIAVSTRLVLVHAVNPFGFAYSRRTNEDNIDLNRNFVDFSRKLPVNADYSAYARAFLPHGASLQDYEEAQARLDQEAAVRGGYQFFKKALQPGQYDFPNGLYYGGSRPSWSNTIFMEICRQVLPDAKRAAVLDIHTGLGASGVGELIFMTLQGSAQYADRFTAPVSYAGGQNSVSARVEGPLVMAACEQIRSGMAICCALEFGTVPLRENVHAKVFENWAHQYLPPGHSLRSEGSKRMRDAYYCDDSVWKSSVVERAREVVQQLHNWLHSPS